MTLIRHRPDLTENDVTDHRLYLQRRHFLALGAAALLTPRQVMAANLSFQADQSEHEALTPKASATSYNNFYEFGTDKEEPAQTAPARLRTTPWTVTIEGDCAHPGPMALEDLLRPHGLQERIYRLRCVEGWSMVIPWIGIPLADLLKRLQPGSSVKYVQFLSLADAGQMPGLKQPILDWPYSEGLRLDEAMNPLALLAVGLYGETLPAQNGAPLRLVVPWKYGFKSIKSIVTIRFTDRQPPTSWNRYAPREYGFYSNVNPQVDHPRWSQARERRIGEFRRRDTLMFNGYGDQVAHLYRGQDLTRDF